MTPQRIVELLAKELGAALVGAETPSTTRCYVTVSPDRVADAAGFLYEKLGARYLVSGGTDRRAQDGTFLISHFFALDLARIYLALHAKVDGNDPRLPSIVPRVPAANWGEREVYDMVGVECVGHPDPRRLVLSDDWPEGVFPMRADFSYDEKPLPQEWDAHAHAFDRLEAEGGGPIAQPHFREAPDGATVVPIGPFFPVLEEPAHFRVFVDGERVVGCDYRGFYNHRGVEKLGASDLTYNQVPFIAERICGICGFVHSSAYCQAVEQAAGIEVPIRARYIRSIILELERVHSHLLWLGIAGHIVGFDAVLMQTWRMREPLMWLCERITGSRKTYGMNIVGGVRRDLPAELFGDIRRVLGDIEREWLALCDAIPGDTTLMARLKGCCVLSHEEAVAHAAAGPTARGSGVAIDARGDHPYAAYDHLSFRKCVHGEGDVLARTLVRIEETLHAIELVREALDTMPEGPILAEVKDPIPPGLQGMSAVEAPRGEVFHWLLTGENNRPERWRVRAPTYANLQNVPPMILGDTLGDVLIGIGSFDPCFSCTERMEVLDVGSGVLRVYSQDEFADLGASRRRQEPD
jgi:Ni,Fe-hydrogenase III large subunit/Ni,Fe-hydrogenase III component G